MIGGALKVFLPPSVFLLAFLSLWSFVSLDGFYVCRCVDFCPRFIVVFDCIPIVRWALWRFFFSDGFGFLVRHLYDWVVFALVLFLFSVMLFGLGWLFCYVRGRFSRVFFHW